jgi:hypothetical protein
LRIGAELLLGFDLKRKKSTWTYAYTDLEENAVVVRGTTPVGGTSVGLAVSVTLDVTPNPRHQR